MDLEAQQALGARLAAVAANVADLGKQLAASRYPRQKAGEELQGFGSQLEEMAGELNPPADDANEDEAAAE